MSEELSYAIGIDLGTTNSCVAVLKNKNIKIARAIENDYGDRITPSYVAFTEDEIQIGALAKSQADLNPENTIFGVKRLIGRTFEDPVVQEIIKNVPYKIIEFKNRPVIEVQYKGKTEHFTPEQISAIILQDLKITAEKFLDQDVTNVVITVPAYFNDAQRQATTDAGKIAGLKVLRIINEPTAAAFAYGIENDFLEKENPNRTLLVFDLGGGTFDVTILKIERSGKINNFEVISTGGSTNLGGENIDENLVKHCIKHINEGYNKNDSNYGAEQLSKLRTICENGKKILSKTMKHNIIITALFQDISKSIQIQITRATFEELNKEFFKEIMNVLNKTISDAKMDTQMIDDVILVGGSTRIPKIEELLNEIFGSKKIKKNVSTDLAVAIGAGCQANILNAESTPVDLKNTNLVNVIPLSLGVELASGKMDILMKRNTTFPTKMDRTYLNAADNAETVNINVYQGESTVAADNTKLATLKIDIPKAKADELKILVIFAIDHDGILEVTATETTTNIPKLIKIKSANRLSDEDIEYMINKAKILCSEREVRKQKDNAMNSLEKYCRDMKSNLDTEDIKQKLQEAGRNTILVKCNEIIKWLDTNKSANKEEYERQQKDLELVYKEIMIKKYWTLIAVSEAARKRCSRIVLVEDKIYNLGRSKSNDIYFPSPFCSNNHCIFIVTKNEVLLRDQSRHGTRINRMIYKGSQCILNNGDTLGFGCSATTKHLKDKNDTKYYVYRVSFGNSLSSCETIELSDESDDEHPVSNLNEITYYADDTETDDECSSADEMDVKPDIHTLMRMAQKEIRIDKDDEEIGEEIEEPPQKRLKTDSFAENSKNIFISDTTKWDALWIRDSKPCVLLNEMDDGALDINFNGLENYQRKMNNLLLMEFYSIIHTEYLMQKLSTFAQFKSFEYTFHNKHYIYKCDVGKNTLNSTYIMNPGDFTMATHGNGKMLAFVTKSKQKENGVYEIELRTSYRMKSINDLESSNIQLHFLGNSDVMLDRFISLYELKDTPFQKVLLCPSSQFNDEIDTTANEYTDSVEIPEILEKIYEKCAMDHSKLLLVNGGPGSGKTTFIHDLLDKFSAENSKFPNSILVCGRSSILVDLMVAKVSKKIPDIARFGKISAMTEDTQKFGVEKFSAEQSPKIVFTTLNNITDLLRSDRTFDVCIVDDASLYSEAEFLPLFRLKLTTMLLVGDEILQTLTTQNEYCRDNGYSRSLFTRAIASLKQFDSTRTLYPTLSKQYRMHSDIAHLPNTLFYNEKMELCEIARPSRSPFAPYTMFKLNTDEDIEIDFLDKLLDFCINEITPEMSSYGIICGNPKSKDLIEEMIKKNVKFAGVEVSGYDLFQGQEKDIIILTALEPTDGFKLFSTKDNLPIALTRAKESLILCVNKNQQISDDYMNNTWNEIIDDAETKKRSFDSNGIFDQSQMKNLLLTAKETN